MGSARPWSLILLVLAVASMVLGNLAALAQTSVRRLLAYSAIAHAGYILLGLAYFSYSPRARRRCLYYILTYGLTTVGAFGAVAVVERADRQRPDGRVSWDCTSATRCWRRCCWCCSCRWRGFRRWWVSGPSSICLRRCWRFIRAGAGAGAGGAGGGDERGVALLLFAGAEAGFRDAGGG